MRDAHGVFVTPDEAAAHLTDMLALQDSTGIAVSAVCNDVYVPNTHQALQAFVPSLRGPYEAGLRSVSVPHLLWLKMGSLQSSFPDLRLKNTVLRRVRSGQDLINHAEAGFETINIDRTLLRDRVALQEIRRAQHHFQKRTGRRIHTAVLHGEGCLGACPLWEEHYQHTLTHPDVNLDPHTNLKVFRYPQQLACARVGEPAINELMAVGLPPFGADLAEVCGYFDIIKLAGRRTIHSLQDCLETVEGFHNLSAGLLPSSPEPLQRLVAAGGEHADLVERWRRTTRACRFQCWACSMCTEVAARAGGLG